MSWDSSISRATTCGVGKRDYIPGKGKKLSIRHRIHTGPCVHPASQYIVTRDPLPVTR
jgi:hypothetical protein